MSSQSLVRLLKVADQFTATMIVAALESAGIEARLDGNHISNLRLQIPTTVQVLVYEKDLESAKSVLDEFRESMKNVDWSQIDVGDTAS